MSFVDDFRAYRYGLIAKRAEYVAEMERLMLDAVVRQQPLNETDGARFDWLMATSEALKVQCEQMWLRESAYRDREAAVKASTPTRSTRPTDNSLLKHIQRPRLPRRIPSEALTSSQPNCSLGGAEPPWLWSWGHGDVAFSDMRPIPHFHSYNLP